MAPPHVTNNHQQQQHQNLHKDSRHFDNQPQPLPVHDVNHSFMHQATPIRRPVPLPTPVRNMSASVFNLNHTGSGYPTMETNLQQQQQQQNQWGFTPVNQVSEINFYRNRHVTFWVFFFIFGGKAQSMAQLNMRGSWMQPQSPWMGGNFNGSNMSLNIPPQLFMHNDPNSMGWNPWMQQYQYQHPMMGMGNGKELI